MMAKLSGLNPKGPYLRAFFSQGQSKLLELFGVHIKRVWFRENEMAFFPQEQNELSVIVRCPY